MISYIWARAPDLQDGELPGFQSENREQNKAYHEADRCTNIAEDEDQNPVPSAY